jgi:deoxyribose-phosphate aldolase
MNQEEILKKVDHTILSVGATFDDVKNLIDDAIFYDTASVCISPCYVKQAKEYANGRMKICTVIGFPSGNHTTAIKVAETEDAIANGADEIDMVVNVGAIKAGNFDYVQDEIEQIAFVCHYSDKVLKVIIETCLLTAAEIEKMCEVVRNAGADYIKTSTGFSTAGATPEDVALMKKTIDNLGGGLKIKAAGGIKSFADAEIMIMMGADRLGTSRLVKIMKE